MELGGAGCHCCAVCGFGLSEYQEESGIQRPRADRDRTGHCGRYRVQGTYRLCGGVRQRMVERDRGYCGAVAAVQRDRGDHQSGRIAQAEEHRYQDRGVPAHQYVYRRADHAGIGPAVPRGRGLQVHAAHRLPAARGARCARHDCGAVPDEPRPELVFQSGRACGDLRDPRGRRLQLRRQDRQGRRGRQTVQGVRGCRQRSAVQGHADRCRIHSVRGARADRRRCEQQ